MKANACIDIPTVDGMTPLMMAVWTGRYEIVEFLVNEGASLEVVDKEGDNCLHYSAMGYAFFLEAIQGNHKVLY